MNNNVQILVFQLVLRPVRKFLLWLCDIVLYSVDEVTAKLDVERLMARVDEELRREVLTSILMCLLLKKGRPSARSSHTSGVWGRE
jgi:hypothetical protein